MLIMRKRIDNSFLVLDDPDGYYHVVPRSVDPYNKYDYDEIALLPWTWEPDPLTPEQQAEVDYDQDTAFWTEARCKEVDAALYEVHLANGFTLNGNTFQSDSVAQQNATSFLTAITAGLNVFPIIWRTKENTNISFPDITSFSTFATTMLGFVQEQFHETWAAKDAIRAATDFDTAYLAYAQYMGL